MFLDNHSFKIRTLIFQLQYPSAYEIWDRNGAIGRRFLRLWPSLKLHQAEPNRVSLKAAGLEIRTELETAIVLMDGSSTVDARTNYVREAVKIWKSQLDLEEISRVSMRVHYVKEFASLKLANKFLFDLNIARFPTEKVFDQPIDGAKNGVDVGFRFEDEKTFTTLRFKTEGLEMKREAHPEFPEDKAVELTKNRVLIDFDRGSLKPMDAKDLHPEEWMKGYFHLLRRDLDKVVRSAK